MFVIVSKGNSDINASSKGEGDVSYSLNFSPTQCCNFSLFFVFFIYIILCISSEIKGFSLLQLNSPWYIDYTNSINLGNAVHQKKGIKYE